MVPRRGIQGVTHINAAYLASIWLHLDTMCLVNMDLEPTYNFIFPEVHLLLSSSFLFSQNLKFGIKNGLEGRLYITGEDSGAQRG